MPSSTDANIAPPTSIPTPLSAPATTSESIPASSAVDRPVLEMRIPLHHRRFSVSASGNVRLARSFETKPDRIGFGQVQVDHLEKVHEVLRNVGFCKLAPERREMSPGYIIIAAHFSDVDCTVELPDARWDKDPRAKKVIDAVRKLEEEGCPTGCKR